MARKDQIDIRNRKISSLEPLLGAKQPTGRQTGGVGVGGGGWGTGGGATTYDFSFSEFRVSLRNFEHGWTANHNQSP